MSFHWLGCECSVMGGTRYEFPFYLMARLDR